MALVVTFVLINFFQPFQIAKADDCYPWSPGYNFLTGECDLPISGEQPSQQIPCDNYVYFGEEIGWVHVANGYRIDCNWAMFGTCSPLPCGQLYN